MFDNIGGKIKTLAIAVCWIGIIGSVIAGIVMIADDEDMLLYGLLSILGGPLFSWVGSFALYGFGQLVENSDRSNELLYELTHYTRRLSEKQEGSVDVTENAKNGSRSWYCPKCGTHNKGGRCYKCGYVAY